MYRVTKSGVKLGKKMNDAPLFYTLAQIVFNPINQIADESFSIQDFFRVNGYPDYRVNKRAELAVKFTGIDKQQFDSPPEINRIDRDSWSFLNKDNTEGYVLRTDSLVFHTTAYTTFEDFLKKLHFGLNYINEKFKLSYIDRIGLRYLDAIHPREHEELSNYVPESLLGFYGISPTRLKQNLIESISEVNEGALVTKILISKNGLALPPDLFPMELKIQDKFMNYKNTMAILDTDYYTINRIDYVPSVIDRKLKDFHEITNDAFQSSITKHAKETWG